jgi:hypothetical protein
MTKQAQLLNATQQSEDARLQRLIYGVLRLRRFVIAEMDRQAVELWRRMGVYAITALAVSCLMAAVWSNQISSSDVGLIPVCLSGAVAVGMFCEISRARSGSWENLFLCSVKLSELYGRAFVAAENASASTAVPTEVTALIAEYAKIQREVEDIVPPSSIAKQRRYVRHRPTDAHTTITLADGVQRPAVLLDLSLSGAALTVAARVATGTQVRVGQRDSRVVRTFKNGFAVEFVEPLPAEALGPDFVL